MSSITDNLTLFRSVIDQAPDAIIFADPQGVIRIWNNAAANLFGYSPEKAVGRTLDIIVPEDLRHAHWDGLHTAVASGHTKQRKGDEDSGNPQDRTKGIRHPG